MRRGPFPLASWPWPRRAANRRRRLPAGPGPSHDRPCRTGTARAWRVPAARNLRSRARSCCDFFPGRKKQPGSAAAPCAANPALSLTAPKPLGCRRRSRKPTAGPSVHLKPVRVPHEYAWAGEGSGDTVLVGPTTTCPSVPNAPCAPAHGRRFSSLVYRREEDSACSNSDSLPLIRSLSCLIFVPYPCVCPSCLLIRPCALCLSCHLSPTP